MRVTPFRVLTVFGSALAIGLGFGLLGQLYWFYRVQSTMRVLPDDSPTLGEYLHHSLSFAFPVALVFSVLGTPAYFAYVRLKERGKI